MLWPSFAQNSFFLNNECAQAVLGPFSASIDFLHLRRIPRAAAIAILADMAPPLCLTFHRYSYTFVSKSSPSNTFLSLFLAGDRWFPTASIITPHCLLLHSSSSYAFFIDFAVLWLKGFFSLLKKVVMLLLLRVERHTFQSVNTQLNCMSCISSTFSTNYTATSFLNFFVHFSDNLQINRCWEWPFRIRKTIGRFAVTQHSHLNWTDKARLTPQDKKNPTPIVYSIVHMRVHML